MFRQLNTKTLLLLFGALIAVLLVSKYLDNKQGESNFRNEISKFDSASVSSILIYPLASRHSEIKLMAKGNSWEVTDGKMKSSADTAGIHRLVHELCNLRPSRLAATDKQSWKDFSVDDSLGTRVKILIHDKVVADLVIGKFSYSQQSRGGISYIRLKEEKEVYSIESFLPMLCNRAFDSWRNKMLFAGKPEMWTELIFNYPADTGFVLKKQNDQWRVNGAPSDSAMTSQFLTTLSYASGSTFVNEFDPKGRVPVFSVHVSGSKEFTPFTVNAFEADTVNKYMITSEINPGANFSGVKGGLTERIFVSKNRFFAQH